MAFNGTEGKAIDLSTAANWTKNYRDSNPDKPQSRFFGRDILQTLLDQTGCEGIRIYYGTDNNVPQLVAVGADSQEDDQIGEGFIVADDTPMGPPNSGQANVLNS